MADLLLVTIELKQQSEAAGLGVAVFNQNTIAVLGFLQDLRAEFVRDQRDLKIAIVSHGIIHNVILHTVRIKRIRFPIRTQRQRHRPRQGIHGTVGWCPILPNS